MATSRRFRHGGRRRGRLLAVLGTAAALVAFSASAAFAYFTDTDSSHPAAALAATLAAPTGGAQNGTATPTSIPVTWTAPAGYTPTGYLVLRCTGTGCTSPVQVTSGTCGSTSTSSSAATKCTDTDAALAAGTTYKYEVEALDTNWVSPPGPAFTAATTAEAKLVFQAQPSTGQNIQATGTGTFSVSVAIEDANGIVDTNDNSSNVTLAIGTNPSAGVLSCSNVGGLIVQAVSGVASFTGCAITLAGTGYTLKATSGALTPPANANSFNIVAGTASQLVLSSQPSPGQTLLATGNGSTFSASVVLEDADGNTLASDNTDVVTLAIATAHNPGSGTLSCSGGNTSTANGGTASFSGCAISKSGSGYELSASSSTAPAATAPANANTFNITTGDYLTFTSVSTPGGSVTPSCTPNTTTHTDSCTVTSLSLASFTASVTLVDQSGNPVNALSAVNVSLSSGGITQPSPTSVTIPAGTSTSSVTFSQSLSLGLFTVTATAPIGSQTFTATITPSL